MTPLACTAEPCQVSRHACYRVCCVQGEGSGALVAAAAAAAAAAWLCGLLRGAATAGFLRSTAAAPLPLHKRLPPPPPPRLAVVLEDSVLRDDDGDDVAAPLLPHCSRVQSPNAAAKSWGAADGSRGSGICERIYTFTDTGSLIRLPVPLRCGGSTPHDFTRADA